MLDMTISTIIKWEQLRSKPFIQMDHENVEDVIAYFYVATLSYKYDITLDEFTRGMDEVTFNQYAQEFERMVLIASQFKHIEKGQKASNSKNKDDKPVYVSELVSMLVMNGMDANFIMNEMELGDIWIFLEAHDKNVKHKLEFDRLHTYYMLIPHLSDKIKTPQDLYSFSWENTKKETITQSQWDDAERLLKNMKRD